MRVHLLDLQSTAEALQSVAATADGRAAFVACDLADRDSIQSAFDVVGRDGPLDVLVNAAGIIRRSAFVDMPAGDLQALTAVNINGSFLALQAAARLMMQGEGGRIVTVASVHGERTTVERAAYAMSKGAMLALTRALAVELAEHRILVNAVAPGPVSTGMQHASSQARRDWQAATPLGRVATAAEVADAVAFLVAESNTFITGQTLVVDGGASVAIGLHRGLVSVQELSPTDFDPG